MSQEPFQELPKITFSQMPSAWWDVTLKDTITGSSRCRVESGQVGGKWGFGQSTAVPRSRRVAQGPPQGTLCGLSTHTYKMNSASPINKQASTWSECYANSTELQKSKLPRVLLIPSSQDGDWEGDTVVPPQQRMPGEGPCPNRRGRAEPLWATTTPSWSRPGLLVTSMLVAVSQGECDVTAHEQELGCSMATCSITAARRCRCPSRPLPDRFGPCWKIRLHKNKVFAQVAVSQLFEDSLLLLP